MWEIIKNIERSEAVARPKGVHQALCGIFLDLRVIFFSLEDPKRIHSEGDVVGR